MIIYQLEIQAYLDIRSRPHSLKGKDIMGISKEISRLIRQIGEDEVLELLSSYNQEYSDEGVFITLPRHTVVLADFYTYDSGVIINSDDVLFPIFAEVSSKKITVKKTRLRYRDFKEVADVRSDPRKYFRDVLENLNTFVFKDVSVLLGHIANLISSECHLVTTYSNGFFIEIKGDIYVITVRSNSQSDIHLWYCEAYKYRESLFDEWAPYRLFYN